MLGKPIDLLLAKKEDLMAAVFLAHLLHSNCSHVFSPFLSAVLAEVTEDAPEEPQAAGQDGENNVKQDAAFFRFHSNILLIR